ncbi:MAG: hypothetical protein HYV27_08175 [Candidatus Hydrogenedentes bacterium]|nr:hypothetical protein [Candidatus Hydrogenedentota bacterium]
MRPKPQVFVFFLPLLCGALVVAQFAPATLVPRESPPLQDALHLDMLAQRLLGDTASGVNVLTLQAGIAQAMAHAPAPASTPRPEAPIAPVPPKERPQTPLGLSPCPVPAVVPGSLDLSSCLAAAYRPVLPTAREHRLLQGLDTHAPPLAPPLA